MTSKRMLLQGPDNGYRFNLPYIVQQAMTANLPANVTVGNMLIVFEINWKMTTGGTGAPTTLGGSAAWTSLATVDTAASGDREQVSTYAKIADGTSPVHTAANGVNYWAIFEIGNPPAVSSLVSTTKDQQAADSVHDLGSLGLYLIDLLCVAQYTGDVGAMTWTPGAGGWTTDEQITTVNFGDPRPHWTGHVTNGVTSVEAQCDSNKSAVWCGVAVSVQ